MTAPDPTAGESYCGAEFGEVREGECECPKCSHAHPDPLQDWPMPGHLKPDTPAVAASTGTSEDVEALADLVALLTAHRPNVVTEPYHDPEAGDQFRTRVKCDGETCNFYREGPRYWSVMDEHTAHLASLLADQKAAARAEALRDAADQLDRDGMKRLGAHTVKQWLRARAAREGR